MPVYAGSGVGVKDGHGRVSLLLAWVWCFLVFTGCRYLAEVLSGWDDQFANRDNWRRCCLPGRQLPKSLQRVAGIAKISSTHLTCPTEPSTIPVPQGGVRSINMDGREDEVTAVATILSIVSMVIPGLSHLNFGELGQDDGEITGCPNRPVSACLSWILLRVPAGLG